MKKMKLNEIKNGMYVKLRNGALALCIANKFVYENGDYNERQYYTDALTHTLKKDCDIMEVYVSSSPDLFNENKLERIWVREPEYHVGDIYYDEDGDKYIAIFSIDEYDNTYPYIALRYCKGDDIDYTEIEPFSALELRKFKFVKNSDKLAVIGDVTEELCNGTI